MLARKSRHKRKRSSKRADAADSRGRCIATFLPWVGNDLTKLVNDFPFIHSFQLVLPNPPSSLPSFANGVYFLATVPLTLFLDTLFVTAYIKSGVLTALSLGHLDTEDQICLDGQGTLILSLTQDTYRTLGLTGHFSHFSRMSSGRAGDRTSGKVTRYIVQLPLASPCFVPGKKGYAQALDRLTRWDKKLKFYFAWSGGEINFPQHLVSQDEVKRLENRVESKRVKDVWVPNPNQCWDDGAQDVLEWVALVGLGAHAVQTWSRPDSTCVYAPPQPCEPGEVMVQSWTGFLTPQTVRRIMDEVQRSIGQNGWASFVSTGFADTPVAWKSNSPISDSYGAQQPQSIPVDDDTSFDEQDATSYRRKQSRKVRRRSHVRKGSAEHSFSSSGWSSLLLPSSRWIFIESIGTDLRS